MTTFTEAKLAQAQYMQATATKSEIVSVGIGYLDPYDHSKGAALVVYTKKGLPQEQVAALNEFVTVQIRGNQVQVPIRIEESGDFFANIAAPKEISALTADPEYNKRLRPLVAGYSVGTTNASGTTGLIVIKNNALYILSNNHVLNLNNSNGFSATLQPGAADSGTDPADRIGRLYQFVKLKATGNTQDSAIAEPTSQNSLDPRYGRNKITVPGHYLQFGTGVKVIKAGRTTGDTEAVIDSINNQTTTVNYGSYGGLGSIMFDNCVIIKGANASKSGDSGSVWLNKDDNYAMAVNFAGPADGSYSIAFPINWAMQTYGLSVAMLNATGVTKVMTASEEAALTLESSDYPVRAAEE
ncbi:trypsin-like serine protease [Crenothrix sp.]|uniref:trypsin-like serine protease n=1 Tax=Crenothrix sp. TaxID=3100433 RepID=UPI00374CCB3C